jgi:hypothetical protein
MIFARGNAEEPVAVAEVVVGEAALFGAEEEGDTACSKAFAEEGRGLLEAFHGVLRFAAAEGGGADDEGAVSEGFGKGFEFFGAGKNRGGAYGGTGFAKGKFVGVDDAKMEEAEIAHGAGCSADVERVARSDEDDAEAVELVGGGQEEKSTGERIDGGRK